MTAGARKREQLWQAILTRSLHAIPDTALLERWRAGELAAGEELCRRHFGTLRTFFATKCRGAAVELAQRTLAGAREGEPSSVPPSGFRTYLFTLARRELYRHLQQRRAARVDFSITSIADIMAAEDPDEGS
jgi:DNA-directed RNA polymerase specialized sigma24 family protein